MWVFGWVLGLGHGAGFGCKRCEKDTFFEKIVFLVSKSWISDFFFCTVCPRVTPGALGYFRSFVECKFCNLFTYFSKM